MKNSKKSFKDSLIPIILTLVLVIGVFIGTQTLLYSSANDTETVPAQNLPIIEPIKQDFSVNENGQTYGSAEGCNLPEDYPDLIGILATNGKEGYAYYNDLYNENLTFTEEELRKLNEQGIFSITIPVYEADGKTIIGEFEISADASKVGYVKTED